MKIDEIVYKTFQIEIDNQHFREAKPEEISQAMNIKKIIREKKSRFPMLLAATVFACLVFAISVSYSFNTMQLGFLQPLAKTITANLPANPEETFLSFINSFHAK
jgi:N-acetyl-anhydromuramyl-L-alanine amidase AmpD